ncbi:MAG: Calx-beta domain-containing protein, partial [Vicinamibacterales bacterium]
VLTRTGDLSTALAVTVTFDGLAGNGTDYETLSTTVNFAAGQAAASVFVIPMADAVVEPAETVILTVVDGAAYDLGAVQSATVTISAS